MWMATALTVIGLALPVTAASAASSGGPQTEFYAIKMPGNLVRLDPITGQIIWSAPAPGIPDFPWGLTSDGDRLFSFNGVNSLIRDNLVQFRPCDGRAIVVGATGLDWNWRSPEIDPVTGVLYVIGDNRLYTVDTAAGSAHLVAPLSGPYTPETITAFAIDTLGHAYVSGHFVYSLDLANGHLVKLGGFVTPNGLLYGIFVDFAFAPSGEMWGSVWGNQDHPEATGLYKLDLNAFVAHQLTQSSFFYTGLTFGPHQTLTTYCNSKVNSLYCTPQIRRAGHPVLSGTDNFAVQAGSELNNEPGMLIRSLAPASIPFANGTLCVQPPLVRTPLVMSGGNPPPLDCSGFYSFHFSVAYMEQHGLTAGATVFAQYWSRDPGFAPPNDIGLSDALEFSILP